MNESDIRDGRIVSQRTIDSHRVDRLIFGCCNRRDRTPETPGDFGYPPTVGAVDED